MIGYGGGAMNPQWIPGALQWAEYPIPGGTQTVVQAGGRSLETLTVIARATEAVFQALKAAQGVTLRTLAAMPSFGHPTPALTASYSNVMLAEVRDVEWFAYANAETARGTLVFKRQYV